MYGLISRCIYFGATFLSYVVNWYSKGLCGQISLHQPHSSALGINVSVMMSADDSLRRGAYLCEDICNHNDGNLL